MNLYLVTTWQTGREDERVTRQRYERTDEAAVETAKRFLRLQRNIKRDLPDAADRWSVARSDPKVGWRIVHSGDVTSLSPQ